MSLFTRLKRMEVKLAERPCPCCGTDPALFLFDNDPEPAKADPCPLCQRERYRMANGTLTRPWIMIRFLFGG